LIVVPATRQPGALVLLAISLVVCRSDGHHVLAVGEIAVVVEAGHEKARYVTGQAWAIHASGARIDINAEREVVSRARAALGH
jgi:hypothetical protein